MLDDASARRAFDLVEAALDRPPEERPAFLAAACADDPGLHAEVLALLQADQDLPTAPSPGRLAPPAPSSLVGERIGPYTLTGEVGQGGMGTVYLARREDLETQVAPLSWSAPAALPPRHTSSASCWNGACWRASCIRTSPACSTPA